MKCVFLSIRLKTQKNTFNWIKIPLRKEHEFDFWLSKLMKIRKLMKVPN